MGTNKIEKISHKQLADPELGISYNDRLQLTNIRVRRDNIKVKEHDNGHAKLIGLDSHCQNAEWKDGKCKGYQVSRWDWSPIEKCRECNYFEDVGTVSNTNQSETLDLSSRGELKMELKIQIDEKELQDAIKNVMRKEIAKSVKEVVNSQKELIIHMALDRATKEIVDKTIPKLIANLGED